MTKVIDTYSSDNVLVPYYVVKNNRTLAMNKNAQVVFYVCSIDHSTDYEILGTNVKNACMNVIAGSMQKRGFYATDTYLLNYVPNEDVVVPTLEDDSLYDFGTFFNATMQISKKTSANVVSTFETLNLKKVLDSGIEPFVIIAGFDKRATDDKDVYVSQYADITSSDVQASADSVQTYLSNLNYDATVDAYLYCGTEDDLESFGTGDSRIVSVQSSLQRTRDYGNNAYTLVTGETEAADSATDGDGGSITDKFIQISTEDIEFTA